MTDQALAEFLVDAKRSTYAALDDEATLTPLLAGSRQLEYRRAPWFYRDVYFGTAAFVGQETVYLEAPPVWAMGYAGGLLEAPGIDATRVYGFLRQALREVTAEQPYRGPLSFIHGDYAYSREHEGDLDRFRGVEVVRAQGRSVYELRYAGGRLG